MSTFFMKKEIDFSASNYMFTSEFFSHRLSVPDIFQRSRNRCWTSAAWPSILGWVEIAALWFLISVDCVLNSWWRDGNLG